MKTRSRPIAPPAPSEEDIRAYAEHLFEQSGRIPNRDVENWLEARACLEANLACHTSRPRLHRHLQRRRPPGALMRGFTMPASDACLWIEKNACDESTPVAPPAGDEVRKASVRPRERAEAAGTTPLPVEPVGNNGGD